MTARTTPGDRVSGYVLRLAGHLDHHWHDWDAGLTAHHETDGTTALRVPGLDQAALHGLLARVRDLGAVLISVIPLDAADGPDPRRRVTRSDDRPPVAAD